MLRLIDAHIHFDAIGLYDSEMADIERQGADKFCILVIDHYKGASDSFKQLEGIWLKWKRPDQAFLFGGLDWTKAVHASTGEVSSGELIRQIRRSQSLGFDGLKLLTGKPTVRKEMGLALDDLRLKGFFEHLEETRFPVLWHVGDPPEFWDRNRLPLWARDTPWSYDESYPKKSQIDAEIAAVLGAHRNLNLILPHFFFMSGQLNDAASFLRDHPNVFLDLAPGVEWMHHATRDREGMREFFERFADRIIYGSDIGIANNSTHPERGAALRRFLETDDVFPVVEDPFMFPTDEPDFHGLGLPNAVLEKVFSGNFRRVLGYESPRLLRMEGMLPYLEELAEERLRAGGNGDDVLRMLREIRGDSCAP